MLVAEHKRKSRDQACASRLSAGSNKRRLYLSALAFVWIFLFARSAASTLWAAPPNDGHGRSARIGQQSSRDVRGRAVVVPGEMIVRFRSGLPERDRASLVAKAGVSVKKRLKAGDHHVLALPAGASLEAALTWFRGRPGVEYAGPNHLIPVQETPDDPRFPEQWALEKIQAAPGWDVAHAAEGVVIAVIDTGVDYLHPDLAENIWRNPDEIPNNHGDDDGNGYRDDEIGWDFLDNAPDCSNEEDCSGEDNDPMDRHGHGTHVAGIAGAVTNNALGIAGAAWNCRVMVLRAGYKNAGGTGILTEAAAADAIEYAAENGAKILNLSWGDTESYSAVEAAIDYASGFGVLFCGAAGNGGNDTPFYPAAYPSEAMIAVGSTDSADKKASTSNYGDWVDVFAPGAEILSTCSNNTYCLKSGTSMATPHVAGVAAILLSAYPGWSPALIKAMIVESADFPVGLQIGSTTAGRINIFSSVVMDKENVSRFTEFFSVSYGRPDCDQGPICNGDLDRDEDVDGGDLAGLAGLLLSVAP